MVIQCAEAIVEIRGNLAYKKRIPKRYRIEELDRRIRKERTKIEAKIISEARKWGVPTPIIFDVREDEIVMEYIDGIQLKQSPDQEIVEKVGEIVGKLHTGGIIHGDLTTSNIILKNGIPYLIDFGLAYFDQGIEARGVDVHVLFQTFKGSHDDAEILMKAFENGYRRTFRDADEVLSRSREIEERGRYVERKK
ncbi:MAG: Kae1-associated kinase Bud32 [Candidatus Syntropharchaeia archaeon]